VKEFLKEAPERVQSMPHFSHQSEVPAGVGATKTIKARLEMGSQYHFTMETQTCLCVPIEDGMDVYAAIQGIDHVHIAIADALNVPNNHINMNVRRLGGGYGAKISRASQIACAAAVAAHLLNRPVRFVMTIEANMNVCGKRYACISDSEVSFDDSGKIQKLLTDYVEDSGCAPNEPSELMNIRSIPSIINRYFQFISTPLNSSKTVMTALTSPSTLKMHSLMHLQALGVGLQAQSKEWLQLKTSWRTLQGRLAKIHMKFE